MKTKLCITLCLSLFTYSCNLLPGDKDSEPSSYIEVYETANEDFPILVADQEGTSYLFSLDLLNIVIRFKDDIEWVIVNNSDFTPKSVTIKDGVDTHHMMFSNPRGDFVDLAIISSKNTDPFYLSNMEFTGLEESLRLARQNKNEITAASKNSRKGIENFVFSEWLEDYGPAFFATAGGYLGFYGCVSNVIAAAASAGLFIPAAAVTCTAFLSSLLSPYIRGISENGADLLAGLGSAGTFEGYLLSCLGAISVKKDEALSCALGVVESGIAFIQLTDLKNRSTQARNVNQVLDLLNRTKGFGGHWYYEYEDGRYKYFFGPEGNGYLEITTTNFMDDNLFDKEKYSFDYTLSGEHMLTLEYSSREINYYVEDIDDEISTTSNLYYYETWDDFVQRVAENGNSESALAWPNAIIKNKTNTTYSFLPEGRSVLINGFPLVRALKTNQ